MTIDAMRGLRIASVSPEQWAGLALALAPWFWMADVLVDVPLTITAIAFLFAHSKTMRGKVLSNAWTWGLLAVWGLFVLSAIFALNPDKALPLALLWIRHPLFLAAVLFWLARYPGDTHQQQRIWGAPAWSFTLAALFIAADSLLQWQVGQDVLGRTLYARSRLTGPFNEPIVGFVLVHLCSVLIGFALAGFGPFASLSDPKRRSWPVGIVALASLMLITAAILVSGERLFAAWQILGLGGLLLAFALARSAKKGHKPLVLLVGLAAVVAVSGLVVTNLQPALRDRMVTKTQAEISGIVQVYRRGEIIEAPNSAYANIHLRASEAIANDPFTGHGMLGFRYFCPRVLNRANTNLNGCSTHPHQTWLGIGIAGGLPALALALVLFFGFLASRLRALRRSKGQIIPVILAYLPLWAVAPMMVSPLNSEGFFINFTENLFWGSLGLCLAMEACFHARQIQQDGPSMSPAQDQSQQ